MFTKNIKKYSFIQLGKQQSRNVAAEEINPSDYVTLAKNYGSRSSDVFYDTIATKDNGYVLVGYAYDVSINLGGNNWGHEGDRGVVDGIAVKLDAVGEIEWTKKFKKKPILNLTALFGFRFFAVRIT